MAKSFRIVAVALGFVGCLAGTAGAQSTTFRDAQRLFYSARFEAAAALADTAREADDLPASELRSSALLFQLRRTFGEPKDKDAALEQCAACQPLVAAFLEETKRGQAIAHALLQSDPADDDVLFHLGKLDLNYIWLQLGTFGRRTGWGEYWEARRSLDAVLKRNPEHVRARVARAWIDYIVDTRLPRGTKWLLGGGNRKRGLAAVQQAAATATDFFAQAEAAFALWDMQVREKDLTGAVATARSLSHDFPDNKELVKFLANNEPNARR